jgi:hypothetical protein
MKIQDCYQCAYNHWGLGIGVGVACVHPDNQKYNPKRHKEGDEKPFEMLTENIAFIIYSFVCSIFYYVICLTRTIFTKLSQPVFVKQVVR